MDFRMNKSEAMQPGRCRLRVAELHPHLMCVLCGGYYVDATTIIECLHSFCKSCLVRYLESNKYCPICEVQVHKTKPLLNIRPDETLQTMVYKLVPGLFHREMRLRQEFYAQHPDATPLSPEDRGIVDPIECQYYSPDEPVSLALEFKTDDTSPGGNNGVYKRYLRCPAAVTIGHLQKLVRNKYGLSSNHHVDVMFDDKILLPDLSIMDVAYSFQRKRKEQFQFSYRIVETCCKKRKLEETCEGVDGAEIMEVGPTAEVLPASASAQPAKAMSQQPENKSKLDSIISRLGIAKKTGIELKKDKNSDQWKEVQLQISESGVMSVTDISSIDKLINTIEKNVGSSNSKDTSIQKKGPTSDQLSSGELKSAGEKLASQEKRSSSSSSSSKTNDGKNLPTKNDQIQEKPSEVLQSEVKCDTSSTKSTVNLKKDEETKVKHDGNETNITPTVLLSRVPFSMSSVKQSIPSQRVAVSSVTSASSQGGSKLNSVPTSVNVPPIVTSKMCTVTLGSSQVTLSISPSPVVSVSSSIIPSSSPTSKPSSSALTTTTVTRSSPVPAPKQGPPGPGVKKSSSSPVGYKTLKCGPKNWNPTISRNSFLSSKVDQQPSQQSSSTGSGNSPASSSKPAAPPRFFKMRNTPRYLGNPASGVKAMYQIPDSKPETPPPAKSPSVLKLDPRTLTPIVSNASSPSSKTSPVQPKGRPPFPSTTLSAPVSTNHMPSSRSVTTTSTTSSSTTKLADLVADPRSPPAQTMVNPFLPNPYMPKNMPNFLFGVSPGLLPTGAQFEMMRPGLVFPPVSVSGFHQMVPIPKPAGMLFNPHQLHRQLSSPGSPTGYPSSLPSPPSMSLSPSSSSSSSPSLLSSKTYSAGQRIPINSDKSSSTSSAHSSPYSGNRSNTSASNPKGQESGKVNGSEVLKISSDNSGKASSPSNQEQKSDVRTKMHSNSPVSKDAKTFSSSVSDNNNTLSISKSKSLPEKSDSGKLPHDIANLLPKESGKCGNEKLIVRSSTSTSTSFQAQ